jgi:hypothetical protein
LPFIDAARLFPEVRSFKTRSTFTAPVKYQTLSLVNLSAGHLTHPRIRPSLPLGTKIAKKAWETLPQETFAVIIAAIAASDLSAAFLGK